MKKINLVISALILLNTSCFADDRVVAKYNNEQVTENQVMKQFKEAFKNQPNLQNKKFSELDKKMQESLVKGYIVSKLLINEAQKTGIDSSSEFKAKLENIKIQLMQQELVDKYIKRKVNEQLIDSEFKKLVEEMKNKEECKASHILVDSKEKANEIKKQLNKGAKFADLAKKNSKDESSKNNGGQLGYFTKGQVIPAIEQKVFSMKVGEISEPIKTDFGWHILKLEDKRKVKIPTKEEARNSIIAKLSKQALDQYVEELLAKANTKLILN